MPNGAKTVVSAIIGLSRQGNTVTVPTHTWQWVEENGLRDFNVRTASSCVGAISEEFRSWDRVVRSVHPTHSIAAFGVESSELTNGHDRCSTPCGNQTPYCKILMESGAIVFLGTGLESNTCFHTVEAMANVPYLLIDEPDNFQITNELGETRQQAFRRHRPRVKRRFGELQSELVKNGILEIVNADGIRCLKLDGKSFYDYLSGQLLSDPLYLLSNEERGNWE